MEDCKIRPEMPETRVASEMKQFEALGAWCTPEFLMRSSQSVQSTHRVGNETAVPVSTVAGRYLASRTLLSGLGQINRVIEEMQQLLRASENETDSANRNELLQMWMSVEGCLTEEEHQELFPAVLKRLFPESKAPTDLQRERTAQKGGY